MAEETDLEAEARRQLEEFQRQQAAAAVAASRNQPNAIPAEPTQEGTVSQTFAARGLSPGTTMVNPNAQPETGIGTYIDRFGQSLGPTQDQTGAHLQSPNGTVGIQGQLSPQEEQFWAANPLGAVKDPSTGNLIGLGDRQQQGMIEVNAGLGPPATPYSEQNRTYAGVGAPPPVQQQQFQQTFEPKVFNEHDFMNPYIVNQINRVDTQLADASRRLRSASTMSPGRHQKSEHDTVVEEIRALSGAKNTLVNQLHQNAQLSFQTETANQKMLQEAQHTNAGNEMIKWIAALPTHDANARYQMWAQELAKPNRTGWLDAIRHNPEINQVVQKSLEGHQSVAEQQAALQSAAEGLAPGSTVTLQGGSLKTPKFKIETASGGLEKELKQTYNISPQALQGQVTRGHIVTPEDVAQNRGYEMIDKEGKRVAALPGYFTNLGPNINQGEHFQVINPKSGKPVYMKAEDFNRYAQGFGLQNEQPQVQQPNAQENLAAPANPQERASGAIYSTPRGMLRWTGTGWVAP